MKSVIVYSTNSCVFCKMAKDFLMSNKIDFTEKDVATDREAFNEMYKISGGQSGVPVIKIGEDVVIGFDKPTISRLLGLE